MGPVFRVAVNLLLLTTSLAVILWLAEVTLVFTNAEHLVPNQPANRALSEKRNELKFYTRNRNRAPEEFGRHDPYLGWDATYSDSRVRGRPKVGAKTGLRAVAVGDSFVFGNEVRPEENFPALLDSADNGLEVLNMGVPGYGIDQSYLKYRRHGAAHDPDIVLFGIYVSDYERAVLAFTAGAKPRFEERDGRIVVGNQPVPDPATSFARIEAELGASWRLATFLRHRLTALATRESEFFEAGDHIGRHVLRSLMGGRAPDQQLLVIHIPRGESFREPDPFHAAMDEHLRALYRSESVPVLDLAEVFLSEAAPDEIAAEFYVVRDSGSVGHLNPAGHGLAARAIARTLELPAP